MFLIWYYLLKTQFKTPPYCIFSIKVNFQGSLLISRDGEDRTPFDLARLHNNWPVYLIIRLYEQSKFDNELKSIATHFLDVFEKMKVTDLNSIRLQMVHYVATNNKEGMQNLLDMFDDTEETWFPERIYNHKNITQKIFTLLQYVFRL